MPLPSSQASSSSSPNLKRKQPSISTFFTRRPAATDPHPPSDHDTEREKDRGDGEAPESEKDQSKPADGLTDDEEEEIVAPAPKRVRTNGVDVHTEDRARTSTTPPPPQPPASVQAEPTPQLTSSQRTEHFKFTSSPATGETARETRDKQKDKLHHQFVHKLGGPDCAIGIGRTSPNDVLTGGEDVAEGDEDEEPSAPVSGKGKGTAKKGGSKLTPMEKQVIEIKRKHMDTVLVVEVGYKFRFFGDDARVAARELGIVCIPGKFRFDERMSMLYTYSGREFVLPTGYANGDRSVRSAYRPFCISQYPRSSVTCTCEATRYCWA